MQSLRGPCYPCFVPFHQFSNYVFLDLLFLAFTQDLLFWKPQPTLSKPTAFVPLDENNLELPSVQIVSDDYVMFIPVQCSLGFRNQ